MGSSRCSNGEEEVILTLFIFQKMLLPRRKAHTSRVLPPENMKMKDKLRFKIQNQIIMFLILITMLNTRRKRIEYEALEKIHMHERCVICNTKRDHTIQKRDEAK